MCGKQKGSMRGVVLICAAASALYLLLGSMCSPLYPLNIWVDANCLLTVGRVMKEGGVLYRDVYEQKGPLLYLIHMLAAMISDSSFLGVYLFEIVSLTALLVLAQRLIRLWTGDYLACAGALLFGACVLVSRSFARGDSAEEFCLPFLMAALYMVCAHGKQSEAALPGRTMFLLGLLAGCVAAIKYTALGLFIGLCAAQGVFLLLRRNVRGVLVNAGVFLAGMILPILPFVAYFAAHGALRDAFTAYIYNNIFLYRAAARSVDVIVMDIGIAGWCNASWSVLAAAGALLLAADRLTSRFARLAVLLGALFAGAAVFLPGAIYPYYPLVLCVFAPVALAMLLGKVRHAQKAGWGIVLIAACCSLAAVMQCSPNAFLRGVRLEDTAQGRLAAQMEPSASLLQYSHLDDGLYLVHGVLPEEKYFVRLNVAYQEMRSALDEAVREGRPDYVLVSWRELPREFERYTLVAVEMGYDDDMGQKPLYLYKRNDQKEGSTDGSDH